MASIQNIEGTSNSYFKIGDNGVTIFYGEIEPTLYMGHIGDIYVQIKKDINEANKCGKLFVKNVKNGVEVWDSLKDYSFDTPIIKVSETALNSNDFKVSLQPASIPTAEPSSTIDTDITVAHENYGVVRFATDTEAGNKDNNYVAITPKNLVDQITKFLVKHNANNEAKPNHEDIRQEIKENREAIQTLKEKGDVADIVKNHQALIDYFKPTPPTPPPVLYEGNIIKVLKDEKKGGKPTYYKYLPNDPTLPEDKTDPADFKFKYIGDDPVYTVTETDAKFATINSPKLTGTPTAPTPDGTNPKQIATVEYAKTAFTFGTGLKKSDTNHVVLNIAGTELGGVKSGGDNITINPTDGTISATDTKYTSGSNITVKPDNSINFNQDLADTIASNKTNIATNKTNIANNTAKIETKQDKMLSQTINDSETNYPSNKAVKDYVSNNVKNGVKGDYATRYGIVHCQHGLIKIVSGKEITVKGGMQMFVPRTSTANKDTPVTNGSDFNYTIKAVDNVTLFYTPSIPEKIIETSEVYYQNEQPITKAGKIVAWFSPDVGYWKIKYPTETGWQNIDMTPIADVCIQNGGITRIDYIGYRALNNEIYQELLTPGSGIQIVDNVISNTQTSANWGNITGHIEAQQDLQEALNTKSVVIIRQW